MQHAWQLTQLNTRTNFRKPRRLFEEQNCMTLLRNESAGRSCRRCCSNDQYVFRFHSR